jgi:dTDP-glucose pyrophosphorylase
MTETDTRWRAAILPASTTVEQVVRNLDQVAIKIVMIVNEREELIGTISDGDIRRGLLKGLTFTSPILEVVHHNPLVVPPDVDRELVRQLMVANKIQQIPVVNEHRRVVGLHLWDEIASAPALNNLMVIMAGGMGTRLRPHTETCPKPMLPIAGKPMLEHIVDRAKLEGLHNFVFAIHYLGHMIEEHFGNGERFGLHIDYLRERAPLGTAGALSLLAPRPTGTFVVTNGDVITDIHYAELIDFHNRHGAVATMAVRVHEWQHPFGVVHTQGVDIVGFEEKPVARTRINAGVYALDPEALAVLKQDEQCDMPTLFERLQSTGRRTVAFPMHEPWLDVGRPDDLQSVRRKLANKTEDKYD